MQGSAVCCWGLFVEERHVDGRVCFAGMVLHSQRRIEDFHECHRARMIGKRQAGFNHIKDQI